MSSAPRPKIVLLGMMSRHPVAGVVWQYLHYLIGLRRLGYDPYYVEAGGNYPSAMLVCGRDEDRWSAAAAFVDRVLGRFDLGDRWALQAVHDDGRCFGLSAAELTALYRSAALLINLHGATRPLAEHSETGRLIYLETDPVALQVELAEGRAETIAFLEPHRAFFTFAENYGQPDCRLPVSERFHFQPTRQPVVLDLWRRVGGAPGPAFTTIGNWRQQQRDLTHGGELYSWSKHFEFLKFLDLPRRTGQPFELALSRLGADDRAMLEAAGWRVRDALGFSADVDAYQAYIAGSRGEFTVAKDQNVRFRSGWFSDRSATYLAAGRPVITQETGFSNVLPSGEGLFPFSSEDEVVAAVERIGADYDRQSAAAAALARECFDSDRVLGRLLSEVGL